MDHKPNPHTTREDIITSAKPGMRDFLIEYIEKKFQPGGMILQYFLKTHCQLFQKVQPY